MKGEHELELNLRNGNKQYQLILLTILRVCMKIEGNPPEKYAKYFTDITSREVSEAMAHPEILKANISNLAARAGSNFLNFDDSNVVMKQLFWQKFREFSIDFVTESAKNPPKDFFLSLGFMRKIFDKLNNALLDSEIEEFSYGDVLAKKTHAYDYGTIYLFSGRNEDALHQGMGRRNEKVCGPMPGEDPDKMQGWGKNFNALNTHLKAAIENTAHGKYEIKRGDISIFSNVPIESNVALIEVLKQLQSEKSYARIYVHADQFGAYLVSGIIHESADDKAVKQQRYGVTKYYVEQDPRHLSDDNVNPLVSLQMGSVFYHSTQKEIDINCEHLGFAFKDWLPILNNALSKLTAFSKGKENNVAFMELLGEFCHLYINIMPYISGSAAIGEWLMYGLAKSRGIDLGPFDSTRLGWDFSAFCATSPEQYGKEFIHFFPRAVGLFEQQSQNPFSLFQPGSGQAPAASHSSKILKK